MEKVGVFSWGRETLRLLWALRWRCWVSNEKLNHEKFTSSGNVLPSRGHSMVWHKAALSCPPVIHLRKLSPLVGKAQDICWDRGRGQRKTTPRIDVGRSISPKDEAWRNNHRLPVNLNLLWKSGPVITWRIEPPSRASHYLCKEIIWRYLKSSISQFGKWWQTRKPSLAFPFCISNRRGFVQNWAC